MAKGDKCSFDGCGKEAIGYQYNHRMGVNVCEDCCHTLMPKLKIGETKTAGNWTLKRY